MARLPDRADYDSFDEGDSMLMGPPTAMQRPDSFGLDDDDDFGGPSLSGPLYGRTGAYGRTSSPPLRDDASVASSDVPLSKVASHMRGAATAFDSNAEESDDDDDDMPLHRRSAALQAKAAQRSTPPTSWKRTTEPAATETDSGVDALKNSPVTPGFGMDTVRDMSFAHFQGLHRPSQPASSASGMSSPATGFDAMGDLTTLAEERSLSSLNAGPDRHSDMDDHSGAAHKTDGGIADQTQYYNPTVARKVTLQSIRKGSTDSSASAHLQSASRNSGDEGGHESMASGSKDLSVQRTPSARHSKAASEDIRTPVKTEKANFYSLRGRQSQEFQEAESSKKDASARLRAAQRITEASDEDDSDHSSAFRAGQRERHTPAPIYVTNHDGDSPDVELPPSLASPTRAAALADVHFEPPISPGRRSHSRQGSREFSAMQRSIMSGVGATADAQDGTAAESAEGEKKKRGFFSHRKLSSSTTSESLAEGDAPTSLATAATSVWSKLRHGRSASNEKAQVLPSSPPDSNRTGGRDYAANEPRPISMTIANEIAAMVPGADLTALTTSGGWVAHPASSSMLTLPTQDLTRKQSVSGHRSLAASSGSGGQNSQYMPVDETDDLLLQLLVSQAVVDAQDFEILGLEEVDDVKVLHQQLQARVQSQGARLALETKIREAARNLARLHANNRELSRQANDQLQSSNRKVDQVATELWKLTQRAADVQRRLLQHTAGTLSRGISLLEVQLAQVREQVQTAAVAVADTQVTDRLATATADLRREANDQRLLAESRQREIAALRGELEAVNVKLQTLNMVSQAGDEAAREAEERLSAIEIELSCARERLQTVESELQDARIQLERQESPSELRAAVQASLRDAMLSKEKSRAEAESERRRREEAERQAEALGRELEEARDAAAAATRASEAEAAANATLEERDRMLATLQRQIKEATEDIDQLRAASRDTDAALRQLFSSLPEPTATEAVDLDGVSRSPPSPRSPTFSRYTFDGLVIRVQGMLAQHQRLTDRVLQMQSQAETVHARANAAAEEKAEAEKRAQEADERAAAAEARVHSLEARTEEAETRVEEAEARVREAVRRADEAEERAEAAEHDAGRKARASYSDDDEADERSAKRIKELQNELNLAREREASVRVTVTRMTRELAAAQERAETAEHAKRETSKVEETEAVRKRVEAELEERVVDVRASVQAEFAANLSAAEERISAANERISALEKSVIEARKQLEEAEASVTKLQAQVEEAESNAAEAHAQLLEMQAKAQEAEARAAKADALVDEATAKAAKAEASALQAQSEAKALETEAAEAKAAVVAAKEEAKVATTAAEAAAATATAATTPPTSDDDDEKKSGANGDADGTYTKLHNQCRQVQEQLVAATKQYPAPQQNVTDVEALHATVRGLSEALNEARVALTGMLKGDLLGNATNTSMRMHKSMYAPPESVGALQSRGELEQANREIERLQRQAAEWNDQRLMLEMNLEAYRARVSDLENA
ncbi:hypothetical protein THASP1DRAFT_30539 [Thamnocephalis sphaerospora]|uniref:Up-regulated during septation protein 1 domain-containing protein n=1 Tax=Thamnocephalis sphaerospora TaxID=78915 RepID=A0A4P9XNV1_9FUNG|nr:hypothetical protein THASP1DRAFT_30539 [Thamnocephalis sphaerospora]|eukprot:RKP07648.1 hypothetical protein THASP1DRAFT_30539 [Thamnocephalis sphaerospora]